MSVYDEFTPQQLVQTVLYLAAELNGNREPEIFDGGASARKTIRDCMAVLANRVRQMPSLKDNDELKPFFDRIRAVTNVLNADEMATAVKDLPWEKVEHKPQPRRPGFNPF